MTEFIRSALELLDYVAKVTPILLAVVGILGFYFREKIKARLAKALALDVQSAKHELDRRLAEHAAALQREAEAYKVSLIAEVERVKAKQDVNKSLALKMVERRYDAVCRLFDALLGFAVLVRVIAHMASSDDLHQGAYFQGKLDTAVTRLDEISQAYEAAKIFVNQDMTPHLLSVLANAAAILDLRPSLLVAPLPMNHAGAQALVSSALVVEDHLRHVLIGFEQT